MGCCCEGTEQISKGRKLLGYLPKILLTMGRLRRCNRWNGEDTTTQIDD